MNPWTCQIVRGKRVLMLRERIYRNVRLVRATGCWEWQASVDQFGYGQVRVAVLSKHMLKAHRAAYLIFVGPIPDGLFVCHKCDNPICVNPEHLYAGTRLDNSADMMSRGRPGTALLTHEQAAEIRERHRIGGVTQDNLAMEYGVSQTTVSDIVTGRSWSAVRNYRPSQVRSVASTIEGAGT